MEGSGVKLRALNQLRQWHLSSTINTTTTTTFFRPHLLFPHPHFTTNKINTNKTNTSILSHSLTFSSLPRFTPFSTLHDRANGTSVRGAQQHSVATSQNMLQVVLVSPQIPGNAGSIARTCAASGVKLHLVEPLGFPIDDTKLKRAGLDYWPYVVVKVHPSWAEFRDYFSLQNGEKRLLAFTKRGTTIHSDFSYQPGDWLVFGSETSGLPPEALLDCKSETYGGGALKIPMVDTYVRCLNLSVSVGIAVYEAARQLNYEQLHSSPETYINGEDPFIKEDIFA